MRTSRRRGTWSTPSAIFHVAELSDGTGVTMEDHAPPAWVILRRKPIPVQNGDTVEDHRPEARNNADTTDATYARA